MSNNRKRVNLRPYVDKHDELCGRLIKRLKPLKGHASYDIPIIEKAMEAIKKSKNPEKENMLYPKNWTAC